MNRFFLFLCFFLLNNTSFSQNPRKILNRFYEKIGGLQNWKQIKTMKLVYEKKPDDYINQNEDVKALESLTIIYQDFEKKAYRKEITMINHTPVIIVIQGDSGWRVSNPIQLPNVKINKKLGIFNLDTDQIKMQKYFVSTFYDLLTSTTDDNLAMEYLGNKVVNGLVCYELAKKDTTALAYHYFIDSKSYELIGVKNKDIEVIYDDYKQVGNIRLPFSKEIRFGNLKVPITSKDKLVEANYNVVIDPKIFDKPKQ